MFNPVIVCLNCMSQAMAAGGSFIQDYEPPTDKSEEDLSGSHRLYAIIYI